MHFPSIPALPAFDQSELVGPHILTAQPFWRELARVQVVDLAPGRHHAFPEIRPNHFYHVINGSRVEPFDEEGGHGLVRAGHIGRASGKSFRLGNYGNEPARIVVMSMRKAIGLRGYCYKHIDTVPLANRPAGIQLKSLWPAVEMPLGAGYEYVELNDIAPRHRHTRSSAVWLILEGEGEVGMDVDGTQTVTKVSAGRYGCFPAGVWHGFAGSMKLISAQVPGIDDDYEFEENVEYDYEL